MFNAKDSKSAKNYFTAEALRRRGTAMVVNRVTQSPHRQRAGWLVMRRPAPEPSLRRCASAVKPTHLRFVFFAYFAVNVKSTRLAASHVAAGCGSPIFHRPSNSTPTIVDTPGSSIVTPYTQSAASIVRGLWVITMNWVSALKSSSSCRKRPTLDSSSGASTSSKTQKGEGFTR